MITETKGAQGWAQLIKEELGVTDANKVNWISKYAQVHELYEAQQDGIRNGSFNPNMIATPLNTMGMGNPIFPQQPGSTADFHAPNYKVGSGDIPMSTLPIALNVAAMTIGLELVPVIPSPGPWTMLSYLDFPYAGGKLGGKPWLTDMDGKGEGAANKPLYIKVSSDQTKTVLGGKPARDTEIVLTNGTKTLKGLYKGVSRIDGWMILQIESCVDTAATGTFGTDISIADFFEGQITDGELATDTIKIKVGSGAEASLLSDNARYPAAPHVVASMDDHVDGFANFYSGDTEPMSRAENETGIGNVLGLKLFSKVVEMKSYEVTGQVTRQQLQDLPLYGVDAVGKIMEAAQNEISQSINKRILERVFRLGVTNAAQIRDVQGADLNLYIGAVGETDKALSTFGIEYKNIQGVDVAAGWMVKNSDVNSSAENLTTRQRRIMSRVLAATNLIQVVGRRGRATWVVTNAQVVSALQDCAAFVVAPMVNSLSQDGANSLYFAGSLAGLNVYVDPNMAWDDTRVCVGRKGDGNMPGVVFMPYILADTVSIIASETMAPKLLVNSRFAVVDAGFHPETAYYTFGVYSDYGLI